MDAQLKKGILDACVLASLQKGNSYGYMLLKSISTLIDISESTLYPILRRLKKAEYLTTYSSENNGRLRKYYAITEKGKEKLKIFCNEWQDVVKIFQFIKGE